MASRVLLGDNGDEYGLYVSQNNDNVLSPTKPLAFDSRAVGSLPIHDYGQAILSAPNTTQANPFATDNGLPVLFAISLSYSPLFAVRWCYPNDISNGKAVRVYNNAFFQSEEPQFAVNPVTEAESEWTTYKQQGVSVTCTYEGIFVKNRHSGKTVVVDVNTLGVAPSSETGTGKTAIYYSWIVFKVEDFTGGLGV